LPETVALQVLSIVAMRPPLSGMVLAATVRPSTLRISSAGARWGLAARLPLMVGADLVVVEGDSS
jgi:hypothetical protein